MKDKNKIQELLDAKAFTDQELEKMHSKVTIMFTDIKGSTAYFEKHGDIHGMAMINRHNGILFPVIEKAGGRIVKTIGDAIMASFPNQTVSVQAAVGMGSRTPQGEKNRSQNCRNNSRKLKKPLSRRHAQADAPRTKFIQ